MKKESLIGLLVCVALIQLAVPFSMIIRREEVLKTGAQFKFRTEPVDPYDAFRGRYVALKIKEDKVTSAFARELSGGQKIYAPIIVDEQGFAKFSAVTTKRPPKEVAYIQAQVSYIDHDSVCLSLPIDRYYMEEKAAARAEKIYWQQTRANKQDAYALVRIKDGFAVIEGLYVGGEKIEEAARNP
ncbi:MAG: GDYXXLXY domain-containing protein [Candidatus Omnitrophota bacterium]